MTTLSPIVRIVDDDEELLKSTSFLLKMSGFDVLTYTSALAFLEKDDAARPGCIVLDQRMPGMTGTELQEALIVRGLYLPIIFLSAHGDIPMAMRAVKKGAYDFLVKPADPHVLIETVRGAVTKSLEAVETSQADEATRERVAQLTEREMSVAKLVAQGLLNKQIADRLNLSIATVKMHRGNVTKKLNCRSAVGIHDALRRMNLLGEGRAS